MPERIMKYGGVKFRNLVPPVKINRFVNKLAQNKKDSLFEIATELSDAGMIEILNDRTQSTIDKDTLDLQKPNNEEVNLGNRKL
ncbi:hypothetical protein AAC978_14620 [Desulfitobacterium sp. THU1]|uniref:hypothetical protein n=1 Tax=Desulfitobacterium sp. THU1 TaxID=3138072 RepID=UPI003120111D